MFCFVLVFVVKQKTAYDMRISDWSSDVCSSDLDRRHDQRGTTHAGAARGLFVTAMVGGGHGQVARHVGQWVMSPCARSPSRMTGGVVNVWCGAGDGTVHSRPLAPSHTWLVAFAPLRLELHRIANIRNGVMNMPNAPKIGRAHV